MAYLRIYSIFLTALQCHNGLHAAHHYPDDDDGHDDVALLVVVFIVFYFIFWLNALWGKCGDLIKMLNELQLIPKYLHSFNVIIL